MKFFIYICIITSLLTSWLTSYANDFKLPKIALTTLEKETLLQEIDSKVISRGDFFEYLWNLFNEDVLESYKYIELQFTDIKKGTDEYDALQKLVYLDIFKNTKGKLYPEKNINAYGLLKYAENLFWISFSQFNKAEIEKLKKRNANVEDLQKITDILQEALNKDEFIPKIDETILQKREMFLDVYKTLLDNHYDKENLSETEMIYKAIEWLTVGTGDKYTNFFPPVENKSFQDQLNGEYEGIGAYVEMETPWELKIVSPIPWSPSEKSGLKGGDIVLKVDGKEVTKENSLGEVVSWIKGPAGSKVKLTIKRDELTFDVEVERQKIIIKEIESKKIDNTTYYIQIKKFSDIVFTQFKETIANIATDESANKIIIDLRNNPGGYLDEVNSMLSLFIPEWDVVSYVKYTDFTIANKSKGYDALDLGKYKIVILQNSGTASASEIMIGTLKDYFPEITTVGETSYGKWSVQTIKEYDDGSSLKFTIAKWFTGKNKNGIDWVGIIPDIELKLDEEGFKNGVDNQLQKAIEIK